VFEKEKINNSDKQQRILDELGKQLRKSYLSKTKNQSQEVS